MSVTVLTQLLLAAYALLLLGLIPLAAILISQLLADRRDRHSQARRLTQGGTIHH